MQYAYRSNIDFHYVLPRLKRLDRWLCWREEVLEDRVAKRPVDIDETDGSAYQVRYREPEHWYTYQEAKQHVAEYDAVDGMQIVVNDSHDPFVIVDFDNCIDRKTNEVDPDVRRYLREADTYAELSPSGDGFHLIFQGSVPRQGWTAETNNIDLEVYSKYISTVTEHHIIGTPYEAKQNNEILQEIFDSNDIRWRELFYNNENIESKLGTPQAGQ